MEEVKIKTSKNGRSKNFYFTIVERIKNGQYPSQIAKELNISKQNINYYVSSLKRMECIKKVGYGTWEFIKEYNDKEVKKSEVIGNISRGGLKENDVRGHGFMFKLDLPKDFRNWEKREDLFKKLKIRFKDYLVGGIKRGQRLEINKSKVFLTDISVIVTFKESFIRESATLCKKDAVAKFLRIIRKLERTLKADFSQFGKYKFRVSRNHYSLLKNSLARQYINNEYNSKKLQIYSGRGLWLLIDNSFNLEELETVHKDTAVKDNEKVKSFFTGLDEVDGYTPKFVLTAFNEQNKQISQVTKNQLMFNENFESHVGAIKELADSVKNLTKQVLRLEEENKKMRQNYK